VALFPALRTKGKRDELWASFGAWWGRYLRRHAAQPKSKRPAREFRPTWATIARECGVALEAQQYLMGHAPASGDMNARYGSREPLSREMHKLSFDGWGLDKVCGWVVPS
jgi:integrase